jgi:pyruvyltransferase
LVDLHDPQVRVIDPRRPWRTVVDEIAASDVVISSSLHGVIVAEAYGIPAV